MASIKAEYIWIDGVKPTAGLRSKTKILPGPVQLLNQIPSWGFDGSSTEQADGHSSDCLLIPVRFVKDPIRGGSHILVLCEVMNPDGSVHVSNTRAKTREIAEKYKEHDSWFGIEQEYNLFLGERPFGFPKEGYPAPQGPYYCGVGADKIFGRQLVEAHLESCIQAGLTISGINSEVMPGQWEFQVGPLGALAASDELWLGRWLLARIGENFGLTVHFSPKPMLGDWNGAGAHTNFSTKAMREEGGIKVIEEACRALEAKHSEHIAVYGAGNGARLTGKHETCSIDEFRFGESDRGASIRIPVFTTKNKKGYLEDRRPAANMDPYQVTARIIETVCAKPTSVKKEEKLVKIAQKKVAGKK
ncbi:MAG: glutamine synthetase beta-grasp domain-containing protein [Candidatus Pacebacteria bacterium]|nr:glutamine synthetase beta-grasp domain-containing protein [Candidatus Paceibacterota bacterium]